MSDRETVEEIRERADVVEVISEYVSLKRSGTAFKGLCPFHAEKTPSFTVNPARQIYHCFGCGAGGDVFSFLQRHESLTFPEVVRMLAGRYGVEIPQWQPRHDDHQERSLALLREAAEWFRRQFKESPAEEYCRQRGLTGESTTAFSLGYAPEGWQNLTGFLQERGYRTEELKSSGVVSTAKTGKLFDTFRNRLVFPIADPHGRIVGFGGRVLGEGEPKYLNSAETSLFKKSRILYGLPRAKDAIRKDNLVLLVEGYMDVIACHQYGLGNAVAALGTALTEQHAALLRRYARAVFLVFDADAAGIRAAARALPLLLREELDVRILVLPGNDDPDTFLARKGEAAFRTLMKEHAVSMVDFLFDTALDGSENQKAREVLEVVRVMPSPLDRARAIQRLSDRIGVPESVLRDELNRKPGEAKTGTTGAAKGNMQPTPSAPPREELLLMAVALQQQGIAEQLVRQLTVQEFSSIPLAGLFGKLERLLERGLPLEYGVFLREGLSDGESSVLTEALSVDVADEDGGTVFADCLARIRQRRDEERLSLLRERIGNGDREAMKELMDLERRWKASGGKENA